MFNRKKNLAIFLFLFLVFSISAVSALLPNGASCTQDSQCAGGANGAPGDCYYNICMSGQLPLALSLGSSCVQDYQCLSNTCTNGRCASSTLTNVAVGGSCTSDSNCASGWCATEINSNWKTCRTKASVGVNGVCVNSAECRADGSTCVANRCTSGTQLPINLQLGAMCTQSYQCLSNTCTNGKCVATTQTGTWNGGRCTSDSNCLSKKCCLKTNVCYDPLTPARLSAVGYSCGVEVDCQPLSCMSGLYCVSNVCQPYPAGSEPCSGLDPTCLTRDMAKGTGNLIGETLTAGVSGLFGGIGKGVLDTFNISNLSKTWYIVIGIIIILILILAIPPFRAFFKRIPIIKYLIP